MEKHSNNNGLKQISEESQSGIKIHSLSLAESQTRMEAHNVRPLESQPEAETHYVHPTKSHSEAETPTVHPLESQPEAETRTVHPLESQPEAETPTLHPLKSHPEAETHAVHPLESQPEVETHLVHPSESQPEAGTQTVHPMELQPEAETHSLHPTNSQPEAETHSVHPTESQTRIEVQSKHSLFESLPELDPDKSLIESQPKTETCTGHSATESQSLTQMQMSKGAMNNLDRSKAEGHISKKQQKKLIRQQQWEENRELRRQCRRERRREKKRCREDGGSDDQAFKHVKRLRHFANSSACAGSVRIVIDCGFEDLMPDKDIYKLHKQIQRCYAENRRAAVPAQLLLTSHGARLKASMDTRDHGYLNWKGIQLCSQPVQEVLPCHELVYLTSDSPHVLSELHPSHCYVIGGLVDHNHHKGVCLQKAECLGLAHAQLPLDSYVKMSSRKVLAVNHVFEILLKFLELQDWKEAFFRILPDRKNPVAISLKPAGCISDESEVVKEGDEDPQQKRCEVVSNPVAIS